LVNAGKKWFQRFFSFSVERERDGGVLYLELAHALQNPPLFSSRFTSFMRDLRLCKGRRSFFGQGKLKIFPIDVPAFSQDTEYGLLLIPFTFIWYLRSCYLLLSPRLELPPLLLYTEAKGAPLHVP
jgi:hypothetical protein